MARGLSELQQSILRLAYRNRLERLDRIAESEPGSHEYRVYTQGVHSVDLYYAEVLREHFGWDVRGWWDPEREPRPKRGQNFSMREIGERRYRSAQTSLSRAVVRLETRGLVERRQHYLAGLDLTDQGVEEAKKLRERQPL
jgi:hypothetical protein